jgi:hypothetical protein
MIARVPILAFASLLALDARASIIFSDLGPGGTYDINTGASVLGAAETSQPVASGFAFAASATGIVQGIDIALTTTRFPGTVSNVLVALQADSAGSPGNVIESWHISDLPSVFDPCCTLWPLSPLSTYTLSAGTQYWLTAAPDAVETYVIFNLNNTGVTGPEWNFLFPDETQIHYGVKLGAFEVLGQGTGIPEPGTFVLIGAGMMSIALRRRGASVSAVHRRLSRIRNSARCKISSAAEDLAKGRRVL